MSHSTRKAIGGMIAAERRAHEGVEEAIRRFDAAQTDEDIKAVLAWAKDHGGWFFRSGADDLRMRASHREARVRARYHAAPASARQGGTGGEG